MSTSTRGRGFPLLWVAAVLGLAACQTSPPAVPQAKTAAAPFRMTAPANAREYRIVAADSVLQILVYRGGPMARLGHNHVITSHHLEGPVFMAEDPSQSRFDIRVPVNELTVDEPAMREVAGPDFPPGVPQTARDGTRKNLLSEALLDAANYPEIRLLATDVKIGAESWDTGVEITFRDSVYLMRVPVRVEQREGVLIARGEFLMNQSQLGLKPFSVAMGTLVVMDEMRIRFEVVARE